MIIQNAQIFQGDRFVSGGIRFSSMVEEIGAIEGPADLDAQGGYLIPGLVDIHTHGAIGEDFSDGSSEGVQRLGLWYASQGTTSFLATTMTLQEPELNAAIDAIRGYRRGSGAKCAGIHLEGPFLSYEKRGAQNPENLHAPDIEMFQRLNARSGGNVRLITVASEAPRALEFIRKIAKVCTVSLGHSAADYDTALSAFRAGASHATHLCNGMPPLLHRAPGIIGAAFDAGATAELICDGLHVHPAMVRVLFQLFGDKVNLISDSLRCAGMPDGNYTLGGQPIRVSKGKATLLDGTLAGSSISLLEGVRRAVSFGIPLERAVYAASTAPAKAVDIDAGEVAVGKTADLVLLGQNLRLRAVFVDGKTVA